VSKKASEEANKRIDSEILNEISKPEELSQAIETILKGEHLKIRSESQTFPIELNRTRHLRAEHRFKENRAWFERQKRQWIEGEKSFRVLLENLINDDLEQQQQQQQQQQHQTKEQKAEMDRKEALLVAPQFADISTLNYDSKLDLDMSDTELRAVCLSLSLSLYFLYTPMHTHAHTKTITTTTTTTTIQSLEKLGLDSHGPLLSLRVRLAEATQASRITNQTSTRSPPKLSSPEICRAFADAEIRRLFKNEDVVRLWKPIRKMVSKLSGHELVDELKHRRLKTYGPKGALQQRLNAAIHREVNVLSSQLERGKRDGRNVRLIQIQLQLCSKSRKDMKSWARQMKAPSTILQTNSHDELRSWIAGMCLEREKVESQPAIENKTMKSTLSPQQTKRVESNVNEISWRLKSSIETLRKRYNGFSSVALMNISELKQASNKLFQEMESVKSDNVVSQKRFDLLKIKRNIIWTTLRDRYRELHVEETPERRISEPCVFPVMSTPDPILVTTSSAPSRFKTESYMEYPVHSTSSHIKAVVRKPRRRMSSLSPESKPILEDTIPIAAASRARFDTYINSISEKSSPATIASRQHRLSSIFEPPLTPPADNKGEPQNLAQRSKRLEAEATFDHPVRTSLGTLLRSLYRKAEPSKLEDKTFLNQVLEKYDGYEDLLASRLSVKYASRAPDEVAALTRWIRNSQKNGNLNRRESVAGFVEARADAWARANLGTIEKDALHHNKRGIHDLDAPFPVSFGNDEDLYSHYVVPPS